MHATGGIDWKSGMDEGYCNGAYMILIERISLDPAFSGIEQLRFVHLCSGYKTTYHYKTAR